MNSQTTLSPETAKPTRERRVAAFFGLEGEGWMRHSNPLSVWTRFSVLPLLVLSIWSRAWFGVRSVVPTALSVGWLFANPLFFGPPKSTRNWASKGVFGERIWADRDTVELPEQFQSKVPAVAGAYQTIGLVSLVYGLVRLSVWPVVAGMAVVQGGKLWFIDRMVLLFEDMKNRSPEYAAWEYGPEH